MSIQFISLEQRLRSHQMRLALTELGQTATGEPPTRLLELLAIQGNVSTAKAYASTGFFLVEDKEKARLTHSFTSSPAETTLLPAGFLAIF